jgi:Tfp pilus assembly protein PilN
MSLRSIINFGEVIDTAIGANIHFLPDGEKEISFCVLKKIKNTLKITELKSGIGDVHEFNTILSPWIEKGVRLHVNVSGKIVLSKKIPGTPTPSTDRNSNFVPGIRNEDFVVQEYIGMDKSYFSFLRKDTIERENILIGGKVFSLSLDVQIVESILPFVKTGSIAIGGYELVVREGRLADVEATPTAVVNDLEISGEKIPSDCLLAYASAVHLFIPAKDIKCSGLPELLDRQTLTYSNRRFLFKLGRAMLATLLIGLAINTGVFLWLSDKVTQAKADLSFVQGKNEKDAAQLSIHAQMTASYADLGWSLNRIPLFYMDQLAASVPADVSLREMEAGVLDQGGLRKDKKYSFNKNKIRIVGMSADPTSLSAWMTSLQSLTWIKNITDQKYQYDIRQKKGVFEFMITIR